jgi:hypothetical protein
VRKRSFVFLPLIRPSTYQVDFSLNPPKSVVRAAFPLRPGWDCFKIPDAGILSDCYDEQQFSSFICCWLETATKEIKFQWTKII